MASISMASFSLVAFFRCRKIPRDMTLGLAHPKKLSVGDGNGLNRRWRDGLKSDREGSVPRRDRSDLTCASPLKQPRLARNSMLLTASFGSRIPLVSFEHNFSRDPTKQAHTMSFSLQRGQ